MDATRLGRLSPRACAIGILVGFALFLIGAQLPYWETCFAGSRCLRNRLIDFTPNPASNNDAWAVSLWLARLGPLLLAAGLIHRVPVARRRAAGYVVFLGLVLVALYLLITLPFVPRAPWEAGAALWPLGAVVMLLFASFAANDGRASEKDSRAASPRLWFLLILLGIFSTGAALLIGSQAMAHVFAAGMTLLVTSMLLARRGSRPRPGSMANLRWAGAALLAGSALVAASNFVAWGEQDPHLTVPIRTEFLFDLARPDFWEGVLAMALIAGPVAASVTALRGHLVSGVLIGGATAGFYWLLVSISFGLTRPGFWDASPGVHLIVAGLTLMLVGIVYLASRGAGPPHVTGAVESV